MQVKNSPVKEVNYKLQSATMATMP